MSKPNATKISEIDMRMEIKKVTPKFAESLLESNDSNRKVNKQQLEMLVRVMLDGKWRLTHQGVAMYEDGDLADGQHRLLAVIESGVTCEMPIFYGIKKEKETVIAIDCGKQRTVVDSAKISGMEITNNAATIAKGLEFGYKNKFSKLTHSETVELCEKHIKSIKLLLSIFPANVKGVSTAPIKVAIAECVSEGVPESLTREFCKTLVSGEYESEIMKNAVRLRNKLMSKNYNGGHERFSAYIMTKNTLLSTSKGIEVKRISQAEK